ncbi:hypothetical protein COE51_08310 [Bacillus pseudomycoides]|nr:hypothetical protein COE51_08310 [Bacillus pseudomycoides]
MPIKKAVGIIPTAFSYCLAPAARMVGGFTPSYETKSTSTSGAPSPSHSEPAVFAFLCLATPPRPFRLRTFRTRK